MQYKGIFIRFLQDFWPETSQNWSIFHFSCPVLTRPYSVCCACVCVCIYRYNVSLSPLITSGTICLIVCLPGSDLVSLES